MNGENPYFVNIFLMLITVYFDPWPGVVYMNVQQVINCTLLNGCHIARTFFVLCAKHNTVYFKIAFVVGHLSFTFWLKCNTAITETHGEWVYSLSTCVNSKTHDISEWALLFIHIVSYTYKRKWLFAALCVAKQNLWFSIIVLVSMIRHTARYLGRR